ncbi:clumping factor B-like isoform X2 [Pecten maximus]|uniref:clumping factor B-like isoform X2 n=1 Tax=Pecten maximus TaxID=6579 RepID=UPI001458E302|nr:clumping factor B-like isoform X2 [Pecten maximus]
MIERKKMKRGRNTEKDMDTERKVQQKERKEMDTKNTGPYNKKLKTVLQRTIINEKADARNMTESTDDEDIDEQQDNTNNKEQQDKDKDMEGKSTYIAKLIKDQGLDISDSDEETSDRTNILADDENIDDQVDNTNNKEQQDTDKDMEGKSNSESDEEPTHTVIISSDDEDIDEQQYNTNKEQQDKNKEMEEKSNLDDDSEGRK